MASFSMMSKIFMAAVGAIVVPAHANASLRAHAAAGQHEVAAKAVRDTLFSELRKVNRAQGMGSMVEALAPMFASLPKNAKGRLEASSVRYALHRFFVQTRGWYVEGLHPSAGGFHANSPALIMKDRVPAFIQDILEDYLHGDGLSLEELAAFAGTIQTLVHKEAMGLLMDAFQGLQLPTTGQLGSENLDKAIELYLMSYIVGANISGVSHWKIATLRKQINNIYPTWPDVSMWAKDVRLTLAASARTFREPFASQRTDFAHATEIVEEIGHRFGVFQDQECHAMKDVLLGMEFQDTGRVLLKDFYKHGLDGNWQFSESPEYLRAIGALDESDSRMQSVIIANYITSQSNCVASSSFYSVCCLNQCESLMSQLERSLQSPTAEPRAIADHIGLMSSDTVDAPRNLSQSLLDRLEGIANHHGGAVPIHGRLFAQWMHHAYPRECPFPHETGTLNPLTPDEWMADGRQVTASAADMGRIVNESVNNLTTLTFSDSAELLPWTATEELVGGSQISRNGGFASRFCYCLLLVGFAVAISPKARFVVDKVRGGGDSKLPRYVV